MSTPLFVFKERTLFSDTETFSSANLKKVGLYRYFDSDDAEIIMLAYAFDNDPVTQIDVLQGEPVPQEFFDALTDPAVIKRAFNAAFERRAYETHYGIYCDPEQWRCTQVLGLTLGLPMSLGQQASVLKMPIQKLSDIGKDFVKTFCCPIKATKKNGYKTRNYPADFPEKWEGGKRYNARDVETERGLYCRLAKYDQACTWPAWAIDQRINDRGILCDMQLVDNAIAMNDAVKAKLTQQAVALTGLSNPNSVVQLVKWLNDAEEDEDKLRAKFVDDEDAEVKIKNLRKKTVIDLLGSDLSDAARRMLELRQLMAKSSVSKYHAIKRAVCKDGRVRGLYQFYGAVRTGRWAGRIVQFQNLPQNHLPDLAMCRAMVKAGDLATLEMLFGEGVLLVLSELIRTAFVPAPGHRYISVDYKAIEARLAAWDAQEEWRLIVFRTHGLIYEASASEMFKVPMKLIEKGGPRAWDLRPKGKITELACGYQGGPNALVNMGALEGNSGIKEEDLLPMVRAWRAASPAIVKDWYQTQDDADAAIKRKTSNKRERYGFEFWNGTLFQVLPTGRKLAYPHARFETDEKYGKIGIVFDGVNQYTHQWGTVKTFGGKLFQNRIQAHGVELLTTGMYRVERILPRIVGSVHDEIIVEVPLTWKPDRHAPDSKKDFRSQGAVFIENLICEPHPSYPGLPLAADAEDLTFYRK